LTSAGDWIYTCSRNIRSAGANCVRMLYRSSMVPTALNSLICFHLAINRRAIFGRAYGTQLDPAPTRG
jgi:hypothetical protein